MSADDDSLSQALDHAVQRLQHSRGLLRVQLLPAPEDEDAPRRGLLPRRWRAWLRRGPAGPVMRTLEPWVGTMQRTLGRWWRRHPLRSTAVMAGGAFEETVVPLIRSRPMTAMAVGAAIGVGLALAAPWRWHYFRQAARGSGRSVQRWALHQMTSPAAQAVLASVLASLWSSQTKQSPQPADPARGEPAPPMDVRGDAVPRDVAPPAVPPAVPTAAAATV